MRNIFHEFSFSSTILLLDSDKTDKQILQELICTVFSSSDILSKQIIYDLNFFGTSGSLIGIAFYTQFLKIFFSNFSVICMCNQK